jgi:small subunit ribosomal protein S20
VANHKSALKRVRQSEQRRIRNRATMSEMRTAIKRYRQFLVEDQAEEAEKALPSIYAVIDRTWRKGVIHANTAARYKSRLARALMSLQAQ